MLKICCTGTPHEIGHHHGITALTQILDSISFYSAYFYETAGLQWHEAKAVAAKFVPLLQSDAEWRDMMEEMKGIAEGAGVEFEDVLALNVRSEISMGMMSEGCTSLSWTSQSNPSNLPTTILAQNWDWDPRQQAAIVQLTITRPSRPTLTIMAEAGLIGKIGVNSAGLGVCLNAIRARGVDFSRLPVHLGLRAVLNSSTKKAAVAKLEKVGIASACFMLIATCEGGVGMEWSSKDLGVIKDEGGLLVHSNHFLAAHVPGVKEGRDVMESKARAVRIRELVEEAKEKGEKAGRRVVEKMLEDEKGFPCSINRKFGEGSSIQTLFGIVMELGRQEAKAWVRLGRPTEDGETAEIELQ